MTLSFALPPLTEWFSSKGIGGTCYQAFYQRVLSTPSDAQAKITCYIAAILCPILGIPSAIIGAVAATTGTKTDSHSSIVIVNIFLHFRNIFTDICFKFDRLEPNQLRLSQPLRTGKSGNNLTNRPAASLSGLRVYDRSGSPRRRRDVIS